MKTAHHPISFHPAPLHGISLHLPAGFWGALMQGVLPVVVAALVVFALQ